MPDPTKVTEWAQRISGPGLDADEILRCIVMTAMRRGAKGKSATWIAVNDNGIATRFPFYAARFPSANFVCIVRDPRDVAVSSWHHNMRVESEFLSRAKDLPTWSVLVAKDWSTTMGTLISQSRQLSPGLHFVKYEDLLLKPNSSMTRMFEFLGAESGQEVVSRCLEATSFSELAQGATTGERNKFFRTGTIGDWETEIDSETADAMRKVASGPMAHFGYT